MATEIDDIFGEGGALARELPGYEARPGQVELARAIDRSIEGKRFLVAEGPTGSGKGFAYLAPVIIKLSEKVISKAIVATANIALQEQLIEKDLPELQRILPHSFTYGLLKGRNNFLCRYKLQKFRSEQAFDPAEMKKDKELLAWTQRTQTGDKSELSFETRQWPMLSASSGECLGSKCPHKKTCFANIARLKAVQQDIVVCNYHVLLMSHMIPAHNVLICDEAHDLEDVARSALGWRISQWTFKNIADWLKSQRSAESVNLPSRIKTASNILFDDVKSMLGRWDHHRLRTAELAPSIDTLTELLELVSSATAIITEVASEAQNKVNAGQAELIDKLAQETVNRLCEIRSLKNDKWVYWLSREKGGRGRQDRFFIQGAPILVDEILPEILYQAPSTVVFISATMTAGNSFEYVRKQLGVPESAGELIVPSPFDLRKQGILVVPKDMPLPDTSTPVAAEEFYDAVADYAIELIEMCGGRSLLLFTSWRSLNYVYARLTRANMPFAIYKQGEAPRTKLLEKFKLEVQSVLLGVASFWEGIDVPGESLTGLLIDKIPFPVPTDPIQSAIGDYIQRQGGNSFFDRSVPQATIALSQGIGRLIRTKKDKGVVMILDKRLITKAYGTSIVQALPQFRKVRSLEVAEGFLEETRRKDSRDDNDDDQLGR